MKKLASLFVIFLISVSSLTAFAYKKDQTCGQAKVKETASAETSGGNAFDNFSKFDKNHDGYLGRREWPGDTSIFSKLDKNHDGRLSRAEYTQSN